MPELHQLQTSIALTGTDFASVLTRFAAVLRELDIWPPEVQQAFADFHLTPSPADGGLLAGAIYSTVSGLAHYPSPYFPLPIRPHITIWNAAIIPGLTGIELVLELLLETTALTTTEHERYRYRPGMRAAVPELARQLHAAFPQASLFLTDELQDGIPLSGLRYHDPAEFWQFDYALLPAAVAAQYPQVPDTHHTATGSGYVDVWYTERWRQ